MHTWKKQGVPCFLVTYPKASSRKSLAPLAHSDLRDSSTNFAPASITASAWHEAHTRYIRITGFLINNLQVPADENDLIKVADLGGRMSIAQKPLVKGL